MKPERKFWRSDVQPALKAISGLQYNRIELKTGAPGIPDVTYSLDGTGWIELKVMPTNVLYPRSIDLLNWEPEQRAWAKRHQQAGAKVWLMVKAGVNVALIDPLKCYDLESVDWDNPAAVRWTTDMLNHPASRIVLAEYLRVGP